MLVTNPYYINMMSSKIHFITGGQRSGKSEYAEALALKVSDSPVYLATSKVWDEDFNKRIQVHKERRTTGWVTIEETVNISTISVSSKVILLDCITLWLTNIMDEHNYDMAVSLKFAMGEWDKFMALNNEIIVVSNEIGLGVVPMEKSTRQFVDLQGKMNQYIAQKAQKVTFMVSGIPMQIKG